MRNDLPSRGDEDLMKSQRELILPRLFLRPLFHPELRPALRAARAFARNYQRAIRTERLLETTRTVNVALHLKA